MDAKMITPAARSGERSDYHAADRTQRWQWRASCGDGTATQLLRIVLDGVTAGDYLTWVRDPEPPMLGHGLRSLWVSAEELGEQIDIQLCWNGPPPPPTRAVIAAGFSLTPEVAQLHDIGPRPTN